MSDIASPLSSSRSLETASYNYSMTDDPVLLKKILIASQVWTLIIAVVGTLGNLLTIAALIHILKSGKCSRPKPKKTIKVENLKREISVETINSNLSNSVTSIYKQKYEISNPNGEDISTTFDKSHRNSQGDFSIISIPLEGVKQVNYGTNTKDTVVKYHYDHSGNVQPVSYSLYRKTIQAQFQLVRKQSSKCRGDTLILLYLSFADLLYCTVNLPFTYYVYDCFLNNRVPSTSLCANSAFLRYTIAYAEWLTLALLAVERCIDLKKPHKAKFFTFWPTTSFIGIIWIISITAQLILLLLDKFKYNTQTLKCDFVMSSEATDKFYFFVLQAPFPTFFMVLGCGSIIYQIWSNKKALIRAGMSPTVAAKRSKQMWKSAAITLGLLLLYLTCVLPIHIFNVLKINGKDVSVCAGKIIYMFYWFQYGVNFIVYGVYNKNYRGAYWTVLKQVWRLFCGMPRDRLLESSNIIRRERISLTQYFPWRRDSFTIS